MRAYIRQQTHLPKRLTRFDVAYVHFYYRHLLSSTASRSATLV